MPEQPDVLDLHEFEPEVEARLVRDANRKGHWIDPVADDVFAMPLWWFPGYVGPAQEPSETELQARSAELEEVKAELAAAKAEIEAVKNAKAKAESAARAAAEGK